MKAKEYAKILNEITDEDQFTEKIKEIFLDLAKGMKELAEKRGVKTTAGTRSVMLETCDKWNAICRREPRLKKDGFERFIRDSNTEASLLLDNKL